MANKLFDADVQGHLEQDASHQSGEGLGAKIEKVITRSFQRLFIWGWEFAAEVAVNVFDASMKILKPGMLRMFGPLADKYYNDAAMPPEFKEMWGRVKSETGESGIVGMILTIIPTIIGLIQGVFGAFADRQRHAVEMFVQSHLPSLNELSLFHRLGLIADNVYVQMRAQTGVRAEVIAAYEEMSNNILDVGEIMAGRWRGLLTDDDFFRLLKRRGYDEKAVSVLDDLSKLIPPISDLIRFQVREAFNDSVSSKFGYDDDYPSELDPYIKRQGFAPDWAKRYWRAHWQLPSPTQAYEMLHRGLIDQSDLETLLRTSDYPSFWRDKLMKQSYHVLTRVDVRRLIQAGMINREKAKKTYLEMGYKDDDAELLTEFAYQGISTNEKDLTKSEILNMYEDGLIDRDAVAGMLVKMGYDQNESEQLLAQADYSIAKAARVDAINYAKEMFSAGQFTREQAQAELANSGVKAKGIDRYLLAWERAKKVEVKGLSVADMRRMFMKDLLTDAQVKEGLEGLHYSQFAIEKYMEEMKADYEEMTEGGEDVPA